MVGLDPTIYAIGHDLAVEAKRQLCKDGGRCSRNGVDRRVKPDDGTSVLDFLPNV